MYRQIETKVESLVVRDKDKRYRNKGRISCKRYRQKQKVLEEIVRGGGCLAKNRKL